MPKKRSVYAIAAAALLAVAVGCAPDAETIAGPDPQFSRGRGDGGLLFMERTATPFDMDIPAAPFGPCDFPVNIAGVDKIVVQLFVDRILVHINSTATFTNFANNRSQLQNQTFTQIIHLDDGTTDLVGAPLRIMVQGEGMLFQDTGIITFQGPPRPGGDVIFEGGPHEIFADGARPDLCAALG